MRLPVSLSLVSVLIAFFRGDLRGEIGFRSFLGLAGVRETLGLRPLRGLLGAESMVALDTVALLEAIVMMSDSCQTKNDVVHKT
jgi:hypothetical protein